MASAPRFTASSMNEFPSAFAPCKAKNSAPFCTLRESHVTCRISMLPEEPSSVASAPRRSPLNFFPVFDSAAWTECFRGASCSVVVVVFTCCSGLSVIFILMPALRFRPRDLFRWCSELHSELHRQLCAAPKLPSRRRYLICCKAAANQKGIETELQTHLCHFPHRL